MDNNPLCRHFLELSLCRDKSLAGSGSFYWKSIEPNSTTQGVLGAIGKPSVAALSHLEVGWRFQVSSRPIFLSSRRTINEEDKFYSIVI